MYIGLRTSTPQRKYMNHVDLKYHDQFYLENLLDILIFNYFILLYLRVGRLRGRDSSPGRVKNVHFSISSRPALGSTQPPIQWVPGALSRG
jgi:hypothetical protein